MSDISLFTFGHLMSTNSSFHLQQQMSFVSLLPTQKEPPPLGSSLTYLNFHIRNLSYAVLFHLFTVQHINNPHFPSYVSAPSINTATFFLNSATKPLSLDIIPTGFHNMAQCFYFNILHILPYAAQSNFIWFLP
jgi:hypothetical protein